MKKFKLLTKPIPENSQKNIKISHTCSGRLRFNLIINIIMIGLIGLPFIISSYMTLILNLYFSLLLIIFITLAVHSQIKITKTLKNIRETSQLSSIKYKYLMCTFVYKEPLKLIKKTLNNIKSLNFSDQVYMVVCMEETTPDKDLKIEKLKSKFSNHFLQLIITIHNYHEKTEIRGKCSNCNYALRTLVDYLNSHDPNFNSEEYFVINFDIDTIFHPRFLEIQESAINNEKFKSQVVWQPLLYYNWGLEKLSFFTRITGLFRNVMMMGALVPFNINIMSVYTASLKLWIKGNYCHPHYQMDDIICYIRWMLVTREKILIKPIYCPTISGPTSGDSLVYELVEWARQIRRWTIGSAEVFHYFCVKAKRLKWIECICWGFKFVNYYAVFMCAQGGVMVTTTIAVFVFVDDELEKNLFFIPLSIAYICYLGIFVVNKIAVNTFLKELGLSEKIGICRDIVEVVLSPFVMIFYGVVAFYGFMEVAIRGKKVCKHGASKKQNLDIDDKTDSDLRI